MKRKLVSLVLALAMIASLCTTAAYATDTSTVTSAAMTLDSTKLALRVGESASLTASVMGCIMSDAVLTSSDPGVATVVGNTVTGAGLGKAVITATTSDGQTATCNVHVVLKGIDVSAWQGGINWSSVKSSGVDFAIIRTGYGSEQWDKQTDAYFNANYDGATANGIKVGVYHFSYATTVAAAAEEARMCLSILNGRKLDYPVFYDIEDSTQRVLSRELLSSIAQTFCSAIESAGYKAGIYSSPSIFNSNLSSSVLDPYDKWVAHWGVDVARYSNPYTVWQYGSATVPGISGAVDQDYSYVDYSSSSQPTNPVQDPSQTPSTTTFRSDTTAPYSFGTNSSYIYKITTTSSVMPKAVSSNPSAVSVAFYQKTTGGYLYRITNVNQGSATITTTLGDLSTSFTANGRASGVISDTTYPFTIKRGATYQFKFTPSGTSAAPVFTTGNGSVLKPVLQQKVGSSYYYKISGLSAGCTGVYSTLPGQQPVRQCVVTVA
ncbi:GH25 family lysozyme [Caproiciproducens sp. CPB-2]|uniref:GH25 family lysozyme n=1 Tax=unclassified Caproiciproducens TaxID=2643836 RepID=UPI0023DB797F|nr:GH25 family lysozyme [Caproiciproducens sp. CPB-2]MDF1495575.1 GH25 family lysozyme [Caproiciproducens sp. CPB-2]